VFERFTDRARQVVVLAQHEARELKHNYIGTEHLLLGLLGEEERLAARVLASLGVTAGDVRAQVVRTIGEGAEEVTAGQIPFTPRAKKALELGFREMIALQPPAFVGTEHILLGLLEVEKGVALEIFRELNVDRELIRAGVLRSLGH
jgi:ATP-dependent Clp protease ATP-binding subunit ClpC